VCRFYDRLTNVSSDVVSSPQAVAWL